MSDVDGRKESGMSVLSKSRKNACASFSNKRSPHPTELEAVGRRGEQYLAGKALTTKQQK